MRIVLTIFCFIAFGVSTHAQSNVVKVIFVFDQNYQVVKSRIDEFTEKDRGLYKILDKKGKVEFNTLSETSSAMSLIHTVEKINYKVKAVSKNMACQPCERLNAIFAENPSGIQNNGIEGERVKLFVPNELSKQTKNCKDLRFPINLITIEDITDYTVFLKEQFDGDSKGAVAIFWFPSAEPPAKFTLAPVESGVSPFDFGSMVKLELKSNLKEEFETEWSQKIEDGDFEFIKQGTISKGSKDVLVFESLTSNMEVNVEVCGITLNYKLDLKEKCKEVRAEVDILLDYNGGIFSDPFTKNGVTKYSILNLDGEWRFAVKKQCGVKSYSLRLKNSNGNWQNVDLEIRHADVTGINDPNVDILGVNLSGLKSSGIKFHNEGEELFYEMDIVPKDIVPGVKRVENNSKTFIGCFNKCGYQD